MVFALIVFVCSLLGITALFSLKYWELSHGTVVAPEFRRRTDVRAQQVKELAHAARADLVKLVPEVIRTGRFIVHEAAIGFAALARLLERQAHRLADLVSHKRGFERRDTQSEFLKKVAEHKGNGSE